MLVACVQRDYSYAIALQFSGRALKAFNKEYACHFRRQAPAGDYILGFVDFGRRLIIEVNGWQHGEPDGIRRDSRRDSYFTRAGFRILRFWNHEIDQSLDGVCDAILDAVRERSSRYHGGRHAEEP
jgi:very-short-patch-repair endonuclease